MSARAGDALVPARLEGAGQAHPGAGGGLPRLPGTALGLRRGGRAAGARRRRRGARSPLLRDALGRVGPPGGDSTRRIGFAETATGLGAPGRGGARLRVAAEHDAPRGLRAGRSASTSRTRTRATSGCARCPSGLPDGPLVIVDDELSTGATAAQADRAPAPPCPALALRLACLVDARRGATGRWSACGMSSGCRSTSSRSGGWVAWSCPSSGWSAGALPAARGRRASSRSSRTCSTSGRARRERHGLDRTRAGGVPRVRGVAGRFAAAGRARARLRRAPGAAAARRAARPGRRRSCPRRRAARRWCCDAQGYPLRDGLAFPHPEDPDDRRASPTTCARRAAGDRRALRRAGAPRSAADGLLRGAGRLPRSRR